MNIFNWYKKKNSQNTDTLEVFDYINDVDKLTDYTAFELPDVIISDEPTDTSKW